MTVAPPASARPVMAEETAKPMASFRLKQAFAETAGIAKSEKTEQIAEQKVNLQARDSFDGQKIQAVLDAYIITHKPETSVSIALKSHKPEISGDEVILEIDNKLQLEKLEAIRMSLQNNLMKGLNNGAVKLSYKFFDNSDGKEEKKLFTATDKFAHFCELNPAIVELKKIFGLELE